MNLFESGGKLILGINALQANTRDLRRAILKFHPHIGLVDGGKHWLIVNREGKQLHSFTKGEIGPKTALGALSAAREELERIGQYQRERGESGTNYKNKRQNIEFSQEQQSDVDPKELIKQKIARYIELVKRPSMGEAKRTRLRATIGRLKERIKDKLAEK